MTVTIKVAEVNEAPTIEPGADLGTRTIPVTRVGGKFVFDTPEEDPLDLDPEGTTSNNFAGTALPVFDADDPETPAARIIWTISGPDAKRFEIAEIVVLAADATVRYISAGSLLPTPMPTAAQRCAGLMGMVPASRIWTRRTGTTCTI